MKSFKAANILRQDGVGTGGRGGGVGSEELLGGRENV